MSKPVLTVIQGGASGRTELSDDARRRVVRTAARILRELEPGTVWVEASRATSAADLRAA